MVQQGSTGGLSNTPQRVARGFLFLDQVRDVENLIRTTLLGHLEQTMDAPEPAPANGHAPERPARADSVACPCGATIEAPADEKWVKCPRCAADVAVAPRQAQAE